MGDYEPPLESVFDEVIAKWDRVTRGIVPDGGLSDCPFCQLFYFQDDKCVGCPVHRDTGRFGCGGSPYEDWEDSFSLDDVTYIANTRQRRKKANRFLNYLKRLKSQYYGDTVK